MTVDQLKLILIDMFQMDIHYPTPYILRIGGFKKSSYMFWSVNEFFAYLNEKTSPNTEYSIYDFIKLARAFSLKLFRLYKKYSKNKKTDTTMFLIGQRTMNEIIDVLYDMR